MKDFIGFIAWKWAKFDLWQKCWFGAMAIFGIALIVPRPYDMWLFIVFMVTLLTMTVLLLVLPAVKDSWLRYKKEKYGLLDKIKHSSDK